ncbi:MAG: (d)CMP kinase [Clostridia bacterium]|nr:(d)CMP kinase [Clostridia bacterium]
MTAIRGATTISADTAEEIRTETARLLNELVRRNSLDVSQVTCIFFSSTQDITAMYPAKAAREAGFVSCALFSCMEPPIAGSLPLCIRVMIQTEQRIDLPRYVYLNDAVSLRKDISDVINIAIDGPAGSGKSTVAKEIAKRLNILHLDTGATYRAYALGCLRLGADPADEASVKAVSDQIEIDVTYDGVQHTLLNGEDVSGEIRTPEVSMAASTVSKIGFVRERMVALQQAVAKKGSCVLEGRDIGTKVLPDTRFKFFVTASPAERAKRRYLQDKKKGGTESMEEILADIIARDRQDETRAISPLVCAPDATYVDTSSMSIDEVVSFILRKIQEKI